MRDFLFVAIGTRIFMMVMLYADKKSYCILIIIKIRVLLSYSTTIVNNLGGSNKS